MSKDAQHSIGVIHNQDFDRDAIHMAVAQVEAAIELKAGDHIGFVDNDALLVSTEAKRTVGVVDPFIKHAISKGSKFFLFLYPNTIEGLTHTWKHWAFDVGSREKQRAKEWLRDWITQNITDYSNGDEDQFVTETYNKLVRQFEAEEEIDFDGQYRNEEYGLDSDANTELKKEFFRSLEIVTGKQATEEQKEQYFGCCC